jgi:hypothetical protein
MVSVILALSISLSNQEQLLVELINRARANPKAEAARFGVNLNKGLRPGKISSAAKPPLAPHQALAAAADRHSQRMLNKNFFSHKDPSGSTPTDRARGAGYRGSVGENIAMGSNGSMGQGAQVYQRHKQLFLSPGHRVIMLDPMYRELGTGIRRGAFKKSRNSSMVTELFGKRGGDAFITGVVYADVVLDNDFYNIGEGIGDISIAAVDSFGGAYTGTTGPSGGYSLRVPPGTYSVIVSGALLSPVAVNDVVVSRRNVQVDFETSKLSSLSNSALPRTNKAIPLAKRKTPPSNRAVPLARRPATSANRAIPLASRAAPTASRSAPLANPTVRTSSPVVPYTEPVAPYSNPAVQIVDDGDIGHTTRGAWSGGSAMGCGADSLSAKCGSGSRVGWTFEVTPGRYRVSATWPRHQHGATAAPFTIRSCSRRLATVKVNQRCAADDFHDAGSDWHDLACSLCVTGNKLIVQLSGSKTGYVVADAIRIERIGDTCKNTRSKKRRRSSGKKSSKSSAGKWMKKIIPGN